MNEIQAQGPERREQRGFRCRRCGGERFRVIYTRRVRGAALMRRRECRGCATRITTWERMVG